ncbi:UNVERIFIED_CONTAM: hypothetical protein Sangu_2927600 [Sesamum angustifolium]|uniref:MULE transposase domain-containing protein n=1 Tax=Sesamum angustifolium TaxID=2727405 RepID=A0AAW2ILG5_9LAMI
MLIYVEGAVGEGVGEKNVVGEGAGEEDVVGKGTGEGDAVGKGDAVSEGDGQGDKDILVDSDYEIEGDKNEEQVKEPGRVEEQIVRETSESSGESSDEEEDDVVENDGDLDEHRDSDVGRKFKSDPKRCVKGFRLDIINDLRVNVSRHQAYRAKKAALKEIEGSPEWQYARLWDYADEVRKTNLGSTVLVGTEQIEGEERFNRFYMCFGALKAGFRAGCRPIIGVDGCHLKGPHGGILLTAVGVDPNNNLFPIAYAVGISFQNCIVECSKSMHSSEWKMRMQEMKKISESAHDWFNDKPAVQWSRSHFSETSQCDMLLNNVCETFNYCIIDAREKPILTMLEWIREYIMRRMQENRDRSNTKWKEKLCPKIQQILQKHASKVADCMPIKADDLHYKFLVLMGANTVLILEQKVVVVGSGNCQGYHANMLAVQFIIKSKIL